MRMYKNTWPESRQDLKVLELYVAPNPQHVGRVDEQDIVGSELLKKFRFDTLYRLSDEVSKLSVFPAKCLGTVRCRYVQNRGPRGGSIQGCFREQCRTARADLDHALWLKMPNDAV